MTTTTRHQTVMVIGEPGDHRESALLFTNRLSQEEVAAGFDARRQSELYLGEAVWKDMGEPTIVTISVEPGDRLND